MKQPSACRWNHRLFALFLSAVLYLPNAATSQPSVSLSIQVDLSVYRQLYLFRPEEGDLIFIRGNFNNFQLTHPLTRKMETQVYQTVIEVYPSQFDTLFYEFYVFREENRPLRFDGWESDWVQKKVDPCRWLKTPTGPLQLPPVIFADLTDWSALTIPQPVPTVTLFQEETRVLPVTLTNSGTGVLEWVSDPVLQNTPGTDPRSLLAVLQPGRTVQVFQLPCWWVTNQKTPGQVSTADLDSTGVLLIDESIRDLNPVVINHLIGLVQAGTLSMVILTDRYPGWINLLTEPAGIIARPYPVVYSGQVKAIRRNQITAELEDFSVTNVLTYLDCLNSARPLISARDGRSLGAISSVNGGRVAVLSVHIPEQTAYCNTGLASRMIRWVANDLPALAAWDQESGHVLPGQSTNLTLQLKPGSGKPGDYDEEVWIRSNDPVRPQVMIPVSFKVIRKKQVPVLEKMAVIGRNMGAYPNPFNSETVFFLPSDFEPSCRISVFDQVGRLIKILMVQPGEQGLIARWNGTNQNGMPVSSGVYLARLEGKGIRQTERVVLIR
ncbi:MAG: T9SS type A sorting domain-containing protein [Bacteroidetes bacterium]|nr:T9SS type A sorting domain-containing protein [Bacteroidota bacterium]